MPSFDAPSIVAARFEAFDAHHGQIEGSLKDAILAQIFGKVINRYFEFHQSKPLGAYVQDEMRRLAPDVLSTLELAQDWTDNPMEAARRQLRADLDAKAEAEREELKARKDEEIRAEVQRRTEEILAGLKTPSIPKPSGK